MKKIILSAVALIAFGFANAQDATTVATDAPAFGFTEGDILLEGNLSFSSTNDKNTETKTNDISFNPKAGYMVTENLAIGIEVNVGSGKTEVDGTEVDKSSNFGAGAFARLYFLPLGERFKPYAEVGAGFNSSKSGLDEAEVKANGFGIGLDLGINYFVTPRIAINFGLANVLSYNSSKVEDAEAVTSFNADANVFNNFFNTPTFGLTFKF